MTIHHVQPHTTVRRPLRKRALVAGLSIGMYAALGAVGAAEPSVPAGATALPGTSNQTRIADPAKVSPGAIDVSSIDFKRGEGGAGRLVVRFAGDGAVPDLRTEGTSVMVDIGNARIPAELQRERNLVDFATPVRGMRASSGGDSARIVLDASGQFETLAYQTGREYVVEVVPRAAAPQRAVGAPQSSAVVGVTPGAPDAVAVNEGPRYSGSPVTLALTDTDIRTVLGLIADHADLNIVAADTVQGSVSLRLANVPWDQALDIVLMSKGLDKRRSGNVIWVAPQAEIAAAELAKEKAREDLANSVEMVTRHIPVNYAIAEDIAKLLTDESKSGSGGGGQGGGNRGFLSPRGSISFDRRTNTLLVIDIPERVQAVEALVMLLDKPVDQVVIESRIVIATENFARELGARFGITGRSSDGDVAYGGSLDQNLLNINHQIDADNEYADELRDYLNTPIADRDPVGPIRRNGALERSLGLSLPVSQLTNPGSLALSILNAGYLLDIELSAMQEEGRGEVISNPRIVTSNQKEAVIKQGDEVGYLTVSGAGAGGVAVPQVQFKEVVLELRVTPTITSDGRVFLNMNVKKDELARFIDTGGGSVPQITKREINTAVLVDDGQTVVVGGVYEFDDRQSLSKVPFLGDIPIVGNLFKKRYRSKEKAELLIFVTPKVLRVAQRPIASM